MVSTQPLVARVVEMVQTEYREMPGLQLTRPQMRRFMGVDTLTCDAALEQLEREQFLRRTPKDAYVLR